jgi:hypothetical protein
MANKTQITVSIVGEASSAQQAFQQTGVAAGEMQVKVDGVGQTFERAFAKIGLQAAAIRLVTQAMRAGIGAVSDYNTKVSTAETQIRALTQSNEAVAQAQAIANREVEAGRTSYSDTIQAIATLTPIAKRTGADVENLFHTVQLLSTLNSGPEGGVEGAIITISEALAGQWTSAMRRFNLPKQEIDKLKNEGVPALEILNRVIGESGVTMDSLTASSQSAANQQKIFRDSVARAAATMGDPVFAAFNQEIASLNKTLSSEAGVKFFTDFGTELRTILAGKLFDQLVVDVEEAEFALLKSYDNFLRGISGGKIHLVGFDFQSFYNQIQDQKGSIQAAIDAGVTKPAADALSGKTGGSPVAPSALAGYSKDMLAAYLSTFDSPQLDTLDKFSQLVADKFKDDPEGLSQVKTLFATAIDEIDQFGQISDGTFGPSEGMLGKYVSTAGAATNTVADLTAAFGDQAPQVLQILEDYRQLGVTQTNLAIATGNVADAQQHLKDVQAEATADLAGYQQAVDDATAAEKAHQQAAQDAADAVQTQIAAAQDAADATARATQAQLDALNGQLQQLQQVSQAHQAAAQARAGLESAVLAGETDEYLKQLDVIDQQTQAIADKWEAEIGGQRRAQSAADTTVTKGEREQRATIYDFDVKIATARENHDTDEVNRLTKQKADYQKVSEQKLQLDREHAGVVNDQFDVKKEQLDKENKGIQANDNQQAKADKAAIDNQQKQIDGVTARQKAEQAAAQERQRQLAAELTAIQKNAAAQDKSDQAAITAAQKRYDERTKYWKQEETNAQTAVTQAQGVETAMKNTADQAQRLFDLEVKRFKLYADNGVQPGGLPAAPSPPSVRVGVGPTESESGDTSNAPPSTNLGAGANAPTTQTTTTGQAPASTTAGAGANQPITTGTKLELIDGIKYVNPPDGYHREYDTNAHPWYVPNGYILEDFGKAQLVAPWYTPVTRPTAPATPTAPVPGTSGPTAAARNILAPQYAPATASAPTTGGDIHIHSTVVVQGNATAADAKRIGDTNAAQVRKIAQEVLRGGARQTVTTPRTA